MMAKKILGITPPCALPGHPLAGYRTARTLPLVTALARTLAELLSGEAYRLGLSPHLLRDVGLPEE
jgi:hypothetical protein